MHIIYINLTNAAGCDDYYNNGNLLLDLVFGRRTRRRCGGDILTLLPPWNGFKNIHWKTVVSNGGGINQLQGCFKKNDKKNKKKRFLLVSKVVEVGNDDDDSKGWFEYDDSEIMTVVFVVVVVIHNHNHTYNNIIFIFLILLLLLFFWLDFGVAVPHSTTFLPSRPNKNRLRLTFFVFGTTTCMFLSTTSSIKNFDDGWWLFYGS